MPREDRLISFEYSEVYKAVYTLCVQKGMKAPPAGEIMQVTQSEKDQTRIFMDLEDSAAQIKKREEYSRDFLAAALMLYCKGLNIPLPKGAQKSVLIRDDEVALRIRI